jgi:hypothetical protein
VATDRVDEVDMSLDGDNHAQAAYNVQVEGTVDSVMERVVAEVPKQVHYQVVLE